MWATSGFLPKKLLLGIDTSRAQEANPVSGAIGSGQAAYGDVKPQ
jgi:hypothetical protein